MSLLLPDCSEFQKDNSAPNWAGIKSQNGGAGIIRISYGNAHLDSMFVSNYTAMKKLNYKFIGVYQYLRAGQDATSQAQAFCNWMGPRSAIFPGTVFMLDLEEGAGDQSGRAATWFSIVDSFYGLTAKPLNLRSWLYSYPDFTANHGLMPIFASNRRTWIASYSQREPAIGHTLWQCNDGLQGANLISWAGAGRCDTSIYHGTLSALSELGWGKTQTPPHNDPPPIPEEDMHIPNDRKYAAVSFSGGQYTWVSFFSDSGVEGKQPQKLRVAPWSNTDRAFSGIATVTVGPSTEKVTVPLPDGCSGISFQRTDDQSNWATVAYNLG